MLGEDAWHRLAPVVRRHYDLCADSADSLVLHGVMDSVDCAFWVQPWLWLAHWFKALVPYQGRDVAVEVRNWTDPTVPDALFWRRTFHFSGERTALFESRMEPGRAGEVVELLRFGIGIRLHIAEQNGALLFRADSHCWKIGRRLLNIPNWALLGDAVIVESPLSATELQLNFSIVHPWFGRTFGYCGRFRLP